MADKKQTDKLQLLIVSGTSGAGKSSVLRYLEDMGYFCVDNIIPALLDSFIDLISTQFDKVAVVVDLRGGEFFNELSGCLHMLKENNFQYKLVFLEAIDNVLVNRFSETRRRHPLLGEDLTLLESIQKEKVYLRDIREQADILIDTSRMKGKELQQIISEKVVGISEAQTGLVINVISFGYRYGLPMDADLTFDVRFLPNPYYNENLRAYTGLDSPVKNYVLGKDVTQQFINNFFDFINYLIPHYRKEGKSSLTVAIGCTGGRHRSVAISNELVRVLKDQNYYVLGKHRDVYKDNKRYRSEIGKKTPHSLNVVALGGGTGLSTLLRGLKNFYDSITAIVTVSDDGGSSGRLRKELGIIPPGDIRNCLTALADQEQLLTELFRYRFRKTESQGLGGHSFGNLFLTAISDIVGDFNRGIQELSKVLAIRGRVLPVSLDDLILEAEMYDGAIVQGESSITNHKGRIKQIQLVGEGHQPLPEVIEALNEAEAIILGPGSLFTSIIPHMLLSEIVEVIYNSKASVIYICNIMTQKGETTNFGVKEHVEAIYSYSGKAGWIDYVLVNNHLPKHLLAKYEEEGSIPITYSLEQLQDIQAEIIEADFLSEDDYVRHDSEKLGKSIFHLLTQWYFPTEP